MTNVVDSPPALSPHGSGRLPDPVRLPAPVDAPVGTPAWWRWVADLGTPLRVRRHGDELTVAAGAVDTLVFLHRGGPGGAVYLDLAAHTDRADPGTALMTHLPGTDVWYGAYHVGRDFVAGYSLAVLDEVPSPPAERDATTTRAWWLGLVSDARPDPLNRDATRRYRVAGERSVARSGDPVGPAVDDGAPRGELVPLTWEPAGSTARRTVWLYLPAVRGAEPEDLLVLFDGQIWATDFPVAPTLDALIAAGSLPPVAAVLVDSLDSDTRAADLTCNAGFVRALADDLLPGLVTDEALRRGHVLTADPARTAVCGQSYGGLAAVFASLARPDRFGAVLGQSASAWWPDAQDPSARELPRLVAAAPARTVRTVLQYGHHERHLTEANRELVALFAERGEPAEVTEVNGGHDWLWWHERIGHGLVALLGG